MSKNLNFHEIEAGADNSRAMEPETISKNGASPKSHRSRGNNNLEVAPDTYLGIEK